MEDTYRHQGQRKKLIEELREKGIKDEVVLAAMSEVPRHLFFDTAFHDKFAYKDAAFPIGAGQTISQPYTVGFQTELLSVHKGMKVLEVGTGSGYQTAVLAKLGAKIYSVERQRELFLKTKTLLTKMGYRPNLYFGDGYEGKTAFAPFDRIIITCGAPFVPDALVAQLAVGGRMVIPEGEGVKQVMYLITKKEDLTIDKQAFGNFSFVPMLEKKQY